MIDTISHPILEIENLKHSEINLEKKNYALSVIEKNNFPTRKTEDWKYTSVNKILKNHYIQKQEVINVEPSNFRIDSLNAINIFIINGFYSVELSDNHNIDGLNIGNITKENEYYDTISEIDNNIFSAINTAYSNNGLSISVEKNKKITQPIHIINVITDDNIISIPRTIILLENFSELEVVQSFFAPNKNNTFTNSLSEIFVKENAKLIFTKVENEGNNSSLISTDNIKQLNNSFVKVNTITKRQNFVRNGLNIIVDGTNCSTYLNGVFSTINKEHVDNHTRVDHLKPNCMSSEIYKGVLNDKSTGVFNGKVIVHKDSQKIEAYQKNNNIIISDNATMNAKPELEIFADDVKCSHGTTTGQFDESAIFYLQTRGISKETAKKMLIEAFLDEVYNEIDNEDLKTWIKQL